MTVRRVPRDGASARPAFDADAFLASSGPKTAIGEYGRGETIYTQGDACEHVLYIRAGGVKLSVQSKTGREAVVALLGPGDFFGEDCLAGQPSRRGGATAITPSAVLFIGKQKMIRLLRTQALMSDSFI
jgi:CRP/FNR family cyclic AMP-dependent transcriptional regulator